MLQGCGYQFPIKKFMYAPNANINTPIMLGIKSM